MKMLYTIGFTVTAQATLDMLTACASEPSYFFQAADNNALIAAFQQITRNITQLRIAQ